MGELGDVGLMGDDDDGVALGVEVVEEGHDLVAGFGVEVSGGLVGEDDGGVVDQGAGDGDALALAAGELIGLVHHAGAEADALEDFLGAGDALGGGGAVVDERQLDVMQRGGAGQQVEGLEDEADFLVADAGELVVVERGDIVAVEPVRPWVGESRQPMRFISVDLPEPEGPMMATYSLWRTRRLTPQRALTCWSPIS